MDETPSNILNSDDDFRGFLRRQQTNASKVWRLKNGINRATKRAISYCLAGETEALKRVKVEIKISWAELLGTEVMDHVLNQNRFEAGKEIAEFRLVEALFPYLLGEQESSTDNPDFIFQIIANSLGDIPLSATLAALPEAASELRKAKDVLLGREGLEKEQRRKIRVRLIEIVRRIHAFLAGLLEFEVSDAVLFPSFFQSRDKDNAYHFSSRGQVQFLERIISEERAQLANLIDFDYESGLK